MKQTIFTIVLFFASIYHVGAQTIKDLVIEPSPEAVGSVYSSSCNSPTMGVIVFKSAIEGLKFAMYPSSKLFNVNDNRARNEYVLCVEPTNGRYRITITHAEYESVDFFVEDVLSSQAQLYRINPKQAAVLSASATELIELGDNRFKNDQFAEAETYYRRALAEIPDNADVLYKLGETCFKQDKNTEAAEFLRKTVSIRQNIETAHFMLGSIYYAQSKYDEAVISYKKASDLMPDNSTYRNELQKALDTNPNRAKANANMGDAEITQGNYVEALRYYNDAVKADPQNSSYQAKVKNTETPAKQQEYMNSAVNAFRAGNYAVASSEAQNAKNLGPLFPDWEQSAKYYKFMGEYNQHKPDEVSLIWVRKALRENSNTPFEPAIKDIRKEVKQKSRFRPSLGIGAEYNNIANINGMLGLQVFSCERLINLHIGLQYTYYFKNFYDTSDGSKKPDNDKTWNISANQLSVPATLQLNLPLSGRNTPKPWCVFAAVTGQYNFNLNGRVFGESSKDFVNSTGISTRYSIGVSQKLWALSVYYRLNMNELFIRDNIYKSDNTNSHNDYGKLDKILENKPLFGIALSFYISSSVSKKVSNFAK